ncbi:MAG: hypothetical protein ACLQBK_04485 [Candidatus Sulfotelmatobacter sp.]
MKAHNPFLQLFFSHIWFEFLHRRNEFILSSVLHGKGQFLGKLPLSAQCLGVYSIFLRWFPSTRHASTAPLATFWPLYAPAFRFQVFERQCSFKHPFSLIPNSWYHFPLTGFPADMLKK